MATISTGNGGLNNLTTSVKGKDEADIEMIATDSNGSYTRTQKIVLVFCLTSQFLSNVIASLPAPFLPSLDESHNIQSNITGWVIGLLPLTQIFVCPLYGKLVAYVKVKSMLVTGLFVCGGFTVLFGMLDFLMLPTDDSMDTIYLLLEVVIRVLQSLGAGAILISAMTLLTTTFLENTTTILSYAQTAIGMGYLIGPAIGSALFKMGGFIAVFVGVGAIMLVVATACCLLLPDMSNVQEEQGSPATLKKILSTKDTVAALALTAFVGCLWSCEEPILEPELREKFGLKEEVSALTFLLIALTYSIAAPLVGKALDKESRLTALHLMICGLVIHSINFLFMAPCPLFVGFYRPLWLLLLTLVIMGIGVALCLVPSLDLLSFNGPKNDTGKSTMDKSTKALLSGLWSTAYALGDFLGPTYAGIMTEQVNFAWTMTSFAFACMLVIIVIAIFKLIPYLLTRFVKRDAVEENPETLPLLS